MKIAPVADVKARFSAYLKAPTEWASTEGPIIVTRHGKPVAVLLSVEDEDELERLVLVENEINTIHPDKEKDELAEDCYGSPDRKNIKIITENTRKEYANSKAMVDEEITKRTGGAADESIDNDLAIPAAEKRN